MEMTKDLSLSVSLEEFKTQYELLKQNEEALRISEERYRLAVEGANDALWDWDFVTNKFFISDRWKKELPKEILDTKLSIMGKWTRIIHPEDLESALHCFKEYLKGKSDHFYCEYRMKTTDDYKWVLTRGKILRDKFRRPIRMAGSISDITYRKIYEEKIKDLAYYDRLTKLPNFHYSKEILAKKIKESNSIENFALFLVGLDNFRNINDTLGHRFGDEVLIAVKEKLKFIIGDNDILCKTGGDEFLIIKNIVHGRAEAESFAKKILNYFQGPLSIHNHDIYSTVSIGIEIYSDKAEDEFGLLRNVDTAMYSAKEKGKNTYELFNTDIYKDIVRKINLESDLRKAIANNEFELYYQPQMDLKTEDIIGVEALIRWNHPQKGIISPIQFIPVAENTGLIVNIGKWVIETVCKQSSEWQSMGYKNVVISINVSSIQLQQNDFISFVSDSLRRYNMNPELLNIEITESTLMKSIDTVVLKLKSLKEMGIGISLDDFGTGYSSLWYLKKLPIDTLKIDKIFIDDVNDCCIDQSITGEIIQLAHKMKIDVVAEGVEEKNQIRLLRTQNCDKIQGYVLSKPIPKEEVIKFFKSKL